LELVARLHPSKLLPVIQVTRTKPMQYIAEIGHVS
jgi:hypothetical protein